MHHKDKKQNVSHSKSKDTINEIHTLFYQGILCSQTQLTKYTKEKVIATTGEEMVCIGRNKLKPIDVLINPFTGIEIDDVNTEPFSSIKSYLNPIKLVSAAASRIINWYSGVHISQKKTQLPMQSRSGTIKSNTLNISKMSFGQETDITSHFKKYQLWQTQNPTSNLILWGVSRGAATTFNAFARYKYPAVKLIILEGCFYSIDDILSHKFSQPIPTIVNSGLSLFTQYHKNGPSPGKHVEEFPVDVPVVFITSEVDNIVPCHSTEKLANALANKQKNDVYLLKLRRSSHPNYMFDDSEDRNQYETFIHAVYERYHLPYNPILAANGRAFLDKCRLSEFKHLIDDPSLIRT